MIDLPNLKIDRDGNHPDELVLLEQEYSGNVDRIALHAVHVRFLAERMGILVPDAEVQRTNARLRRQAARA